MIELHAASIDINSLKIVHIAGILGYRLHWSCGRGGSHYSDTGGNEADQDGPDENYHDKGSHRLPPSHGTK